jgi:hypothetical protein
MIDLLAFILTEEVEREGALNTGALRPRVISRCNRVVVGRKRV